MQHLKLILTATLGTALEWAEYTFFAYMADQLSTKFFSITDPSAARLKTYAIFATGYFMRPLGAILFGTLGDKIGRKPALVGAMSLMAFATTAIGFLPTYADIGIYAALLLMSCRLLQGLAVAGEFNGAAVFMLEHIETRPFWIGCFIPFAATLGMVFGGLTATITALPNMPDWAWRFPFWFSGVGFLIALYLRQSLTETPAFKAFLKAQTQFSASGPGLAPTPTKSTHTFPLFSVFKENKKALFTTMAMAMFVTVYVYIGNIYYKTLSIQVGGLPPNIASQIITFGQLLAASLTVVFGFFADRLGGKRMCLTGLLIAMACGPIIMIFARTGDITFTLIGQIIYAVINALVSATFMALIIKPFQIQNRYTGSSFAWSISAALFGGTALMVSEWLTSYLEFTQGPGLYMSLVALIAFVSIRKGSSLFSGHPHKVEGVKSGFWTPS